jgi:hypothetical protein
VSEHWDAPSSRNRHWQPPGHRLPILTASRSAARHTARARFIRCRRVFPGQR